MPYKFLEDVAIADVAYEVTAADLNELFADAAKAMFEIMVDIKTLKPITEKKLVMENETVDGLMYDWLSELIFVKDVDGLLLGEFDVNVKEFETKLTLEATMKGDAIDYDKYKPLLDVKAVTMHMFEVVQTEKGWKATVVLDI